MKVGKIVILMLVGWLSMPGLADNTPGAQPFYKNPQWLSTIRVSGLMQLWAWETRNQWWSPEWQITYRPQMSGKQVPATILSQRPLTPAEFLYYSYQPEARFYPPEVARVLGHEVGRLHQRITVSPLELIDAAIRFYQKYHFRAALTPNTLLAVTPRQVRILQILWKHNFLTVPALYQQFTTLFPDEAIVFPVFQEELQQLAQLGMVRLNSRGQLTYVTPRVSRAYFLYSLRQAFRNVDAVQQPQEYQHFRHLLTILQGE